MMDSGLVRGWRHDARTASEVAHARPAYAAGIRAACVTVAPLLLAMVVTLPGGGATWMSLAGLNGTLIDRGGPYRLRATVMGMLALTGAVVVIAGSLAGRHPPVAIAATFVIAFACGLTRGWLDVGPGFGVTLLVIFAISIAIPAASVPDAFLRGAYVVAGGAWAMALALVLWPIRPYRPVRLRIGECYRAIARYLEAATAELGQAHGADSATLTSHVVAVRHAIDSARTALALMRRGRAAESARGERLLVLHEIADQVFAHIIALLELSSPDSPTSSLEHEHLVLSATLAEAAVTMRALADAVESETDLPRVPISWNGAGLRAVNDSMGEIVDRMVDYVSAAVELLASLNTGVQPPAVAGSIEAVAPPTEPPLFSIEAFTRPAEVVLHHALRVAIVTTLAVAVTTILRLNHGYWVTLTVVVILQPYAATTRQKALQRVAGTILGGVVAAALSGLFHDRIAVLVLIALFTMSCIALLPLNYGAYAVFGTPAFVLLAESSTGDWHLAGLRIVNTLIGGALALAGAQLLWPGDERNRLPELVATAIRANAEFLRRAIGLFSSKGAELGDLRDPRRAVGNASLNAEDSLQRLISEHRGPPEDLEPIMATLIYVRRLAATTAALAIAARSAKPDDATLLRPFAAASNAILEDIAESILQRRRPAEFPAPGTVPIPTDAASPVVHQRVVRLARQLKLMHSAASRWAAGGTPVRG